MSQPNLNLFHEDSFAEKQAGTSMPKIMEADLLQIVLFDYLIRDLEPLYFPQMVNVVKPIPMAETTPEELAGEEKARKKGYFQDAG